MKEKITITKKEFKEAESHAMDWLSSKCVNSDVDALTTLRYGILACQLFEQMETSLFKEGADNGN